MVREEKREELTVWNRTKIVFDWAETKYIQVQN